MAAPVLTVSHRRFSVAQARALLRAGKGTQARTFTLVGLALVAFFLLLALAAPLLAADPTVPTQDLGQAPSGAHPFGTTRIGFDVYAQAVWGSRIALEVVLAASALSLVVAVPLGLFSGYLGGWLDRALVLVMDSIYAFPGLLLAIVVATLFRPAAQLPFLGVSLAISVVYIPQYFRVVRNQTAGVKAEPYVEAARALGARPRHIVSKYVFYNVVPSVPVILTLNAADAILTLAGLGFLGYGLPPPTPEWGYNLSRAASEIAYAQPLWWTSVFPGLFIVLLVVGITLLGEGLNDLLNPLLRERAR
ncbi:MAG: ABC transporter permease [Halobacteriales archaeon]|nr:ABC transporter permease [Halobacteriales archaeon]